MKIGFDVESIDPFALTSYPLIERFNAPVAPGIYFIFQDNEMLYIGFAGNLFERLNNQPHLGVKTCLQQFPNCRVACFPLTIDGEIRDVRDSRNLYERAALYRIERVLLLKFKPRFNGLNAPQHKQSFSVSVKQEVYQKLDTYCTINKVTKADTVSRLIELFLDKLDQAENEAA